MSDMWRHMISLSWTSFEPQDVPKADEHSRIVGETRRADSLTRPCAKWMFIANNPPDLSPTPRLSLTCPFHIRKIFRQ